MPYWEAFRKPERKRREIDWGDVFERIVAGFMILIVVGGFAFVGWAIWDDCNKVHIENSVTSGTVVDMGSYLPGGKTTRKQYGYWIRVTNGEHTATWDVSDTYYSMVQIGDHVEKGILPMEVSGNE